jgi:hypothetical protein
MYSFGGGYVISGMRDAPQKNVFSPADDKRY